MRPDVTRFQYSKLTDIISKVVECNTLQEGCVGAMYDPKTKECLLEFGGSQQCDNKPRVLTHRTKEPVWIQCTSCSKSSRQITPCLLRID